MKEQLIEANTRRFVGYHGYYYCSAGSLALSFRRRDTLMS